MIVMEAVSGPRTQSWSLAGGNSDCSVGPGVGWGLTTVQPAEAPDMLETGVPAAVGPAVALDGSPAWVA